MPEYKNNSDVLKVQGIMEKGYGIIPKLPMQDTRLSIEAKGIYSYFRSYAGAGTTAFPGKDKILYDLQIGETRYYKHLNLLKKYGYIKVEQNVDNTGKFRNNIYTLVEVLEPHPQNDGTDEKPYHRFTCTDNPCTENDGTNNNISKINNLYNEQSNPIVSTNTNISEIKKGSKKEKKDKIGLDEKNKQTEASAEKDKIKESLRDASTHQSTMHSQKPSAIKYDYNKTYETIKKNISFDYFVKDLKTNKTLLDEIVSVIASTICAEYKDGYITMGEERIQAETVRSVFFKLSYEHIEYFMDCFNQQTNPIIRLPSYIRKSLYYNYSTISHHFSNRVHVDFPQYAVSKNIQK